MDIEHETRDGATVTLTRDELLLLNNALNEVSNGITMTEDEFQTRLGVDRKKARALLKQLSQLLPR